MKKIIFLLLISTASHAQINAFVSGSVGHLNNASVGLRAGLIVADKVKIEGGVSFSQKLPFQHHASIGYIIGNDWQIAPAVGAVFSQHGNDKHRNATRIGYGLQVSKQVNIEGLVAQDVFHSVQVVAEWFGRYVGAGFRLVL